MMFILALKILMFFHRFEDDQRKRWGLVINYIGDFFYSGEDLKNQSRGKTTLYQIPKDSLNGSLNPIVKSEFSLLQIVSLPRLRGQGYLTIYS